MNFPGEKTRVLHTISWASRGGVEKLRLILADELQENRYEHALICQRATEEMKDAFRSRAWSIHEVGLARNILDPMWYISAVKIARAFKPDVIHGAVFEGNALAVICSLSLGGVPVVLEEQSDGRGRSWRGVALLRFLSRFSDKFIGTSPEIADYLLKKVGVSERKVITVVNASLGYEKPSPHAREAFREKLGISSEDFLFGSVGRLLEDHKKFSVLIQALHKLILRGQKAHLVLVGDGPDRDWYQELVREMDLANHVTFSGFVEDVSPWLSAMDVFVLPSAGEAMPLALIEAMKMGLPCIATSVGGNPFALDWGRAGILVQPGFDSELFEKIEEMIKFPNLRNRLGLRAEERATREFDTKHYSEKISAIWDELLYSPNR